MFRFDRYLPLIAILYSNISFRNEIFYDKIMHFAIKYLAETLFGGNPGYKFDSFMGDSQPN